ncbi:MAG: cbb3-type cytochrome c oxidase subunit I [Methylacidiphilales bacterium]|nr:cbb3-type cytochrome c oxidase subunit I [Candidatus Methylacidiphilales bacterium]
MDDSSSSAAESHLISAPASSSHGHDHHDAHGHDHGHDHHELGFIRTYIFSTDHKVIGVQYLLAGLFLLLFGFGLMLLMRWQLAFPGQPLTWANAHNHIMYQVHEVMYHLGLGEMPSVPAVVPADPNDPPLLQRIFGQQMAGGVMSGDFYNTLGAMHGTIMVFFGIVPIGFAAFGNFAMPLQIGAPDMTFPRLNMGSVILFGISAVLMVGSFLCPGGAAKSGWTSYTPLASIADQPQHYHLLGMQSWVDASADSPEYPTWWARVLTGQSMWIIALAFNITSSLLSSVNFIATIVQLRAKGLGWMRLPFFVWTQFVTAFLLLLAFPPLEAAAIMQLMDRISGSSLFSPAGLVVSGTPWHGTGGGSPLLWQHLFWFLGHPEVYVLILPGLGVIAEVVSNNARKPLWGYKQMVGGLLVLGFLSMIVWAHHMYLTGMGTAVSTFFQFTTIIISVPTILILSSLIISLWGGSIRFTSPMLWATAFLPLFGIGGLTGIPLAFNAPDTFLHDSYYIIAHFHYVIAPGTIFAFFAGITYWYPKATGRVMSEFWNKVHFWPTMILMNCIFFPMFLQGMAGMHRRMYDGGATYEMLNQNVLHWNVFISESAWLLGLAQIPFIFNFLLSWKYGRKVSDNPWEATTLEWTAPSPPPHGNFPVTPVVYRGPYEYSVPGHDKDFTPQAEPPSVTKPIPISGPAPEDERIIGLPPLS